ncbi:alpha/beta hydrolase domain-containing protein [Aureimonas jatrophae]|uniref:Alpha/beta hydrolase domain-containing protein n=1 Tax=Aureimonas jatrophae TaxID=1166073 RepID=A0A1H0FPG3_9HYPH|nr:alpha/beta hydrolase domain-containing protein [Aureimonas jatrophae]MBB3949924.1 hypothetical protein [Aureimonas jatrophae]SDN96422.1 hypothetical protein SAMN05192530_102610 [Aureimonas jatrophae]
MNSEHRRIARTLTGSLLLGAAMLAGPAEARIVRFEILETVPAFGGRSFGDVGSYELVRARAIGELDPKHPRNAVIADLDLAPTEGDGMVGYSTEVEILRPADPAKGNHRLFFEVLNRGNKLAPGNYNDAPSGNDMRKPEAAGNGFLMERGYTIAWAGWQSGKNVADGNGRMKAALPEARETGGVVIAAPVIMSQIFNKTEGGDIPLLFDVRDPEASDTRVLVHNHAGETPMEVPREAWSFAGPRTLRIDRRHASLARFDAGAQYDVVYTAVNPDVSGIGFAATRDVASFLRNDGTASNPVAGTIRYALSHGTSQSGRMLKGFLRLGFNEDEDGRIVFEGVNPNVSGAHAIALNERFGDANATGRAYERFANAAIEFPFTYGTLTDAETGATDGILKVCSANDTCPKVFHTDGGNEAWGKAAMLVTTDGRGHDIELPEDVRYYYYASVEHDPKTTIDRGYCQQQTNPNRWQPLARALLVDLDLWSTAGVAPPDSAYARVADGTLAPTLPREAIGFPAIPGVSYNGTINRIGVQDRTQLPYTYREGTGYTVLAPRTDRDGNDLAGIRSVDIAVPLGTHTGWGLRREGFAAGEECQLNGQFIPFAATRSEKEASGDPRLSIEERYASPGAYVRAVAEAAEDLVDRRFLLPEDADGQVAAAAQRIGGGQLPRQTKVGLAP